MVSEWCFNMSNEHYRSVCYSKSEAADIVKKNADMMEKRAIEISKARTGAADMRDAKDLGITLEEYRRLVL